MLTKYLSWLEFFTPVDVVVAAVYVVAASAAVVVYVAVVYVAVVVLIPNAICRDNESGLCAEQHYIQLQPAKAGEREREMEKGRERGGVSGRVEALQHRGCCKLFSKLNPLAGDIARKWLGNYAPEKARAPCVGVCVPVRVQVCAHITQQQRHKNSNYINYGSSSNGNRSCNSYDIARKLKCILQVASSRAEAHHGKEMWVVWRCEGEGRGGRRRCRTGGAVGGVTELASWATTSCCNRSVNHLSNALATLPLIALPHAIFASFTPPLSFLPLPPHLLFVHVQWEIQFPKATIIQESKVLAHARKPTAIGLAPLPLSLSISLSFPLPSLIAFIVYIVWYIPLHTL